MRYFLYLFSALMLFFTSACSEAIPTVTDLSSPIPSTTPVGEVSSGGGLIQGTNYKVYGKTSSVGNVMVGTNYKIKSVTEN